MANYNKVILAGRLSRDVELRYTQAGKPIGTLSLAVNREWRTETGEKKEECSFIDCTSFGKQAETLGQYVKKGSQLLVEGRLKLDTWDDKQTGAKRSKLGVVIEQFQFLDGKRSEGAPTQRTAPAASAPAPDGPTPDDDCPF
jgi:single-strand DNA-binding protein